MTVIGWIQIAALLRDRRRAREAARRLHDARLQRRAHLPVAGAAAGRARSTGWRRRRDARAALADLCGRHAAVPRRRLPHPLCAACACRRVLPLNPQACRRSRPTSSFNTAVSFVTNTNWQNYGGESTMCYLIQMARPHRQNFVSAATGIALAVALIRGFARASSEDGRQFLGRSHPLHALHPAADLRRLRAVPGLAGRAADARRLCRRDDARRRQADDRGRARSPRRSRSRCSAPMAAASSTPTPRIRSRTRRRSPTSSRWSRSSRSAPR